MRRKLTRIAWTANAIFGGLFFFVILIVYLLKENNHHVDTPLTRVEYVRENAGNSFDYYLGYAMFTVNDHSASSYKGQDELPLILYEFGFRFTYLCLLIAIWCCCLYVVWRADAYSKYQTASLPRSRKIRLWACITTTVLSLYGVYYIPVYCLNFWLK